MTPAYITVSKVYIDGAQAVQSNIVSGAPSPTAVAGYGYALCLAHGLTHCGSALFVHDFERHAGHNKFVPERGDKAAPTVDNQTTDLLVTLVVTVKIPDDCDLDGLLDRVRQQQHRFAGGKITNAYGIADSPHLRFRQAEIKVYYGEDDLIKYLRTLGQGSILVDRSDLIQSRQDGIDPLDAVLDALAVTKDEKKDTYSRKQKGWLVPIQIGFQAIERPNTTRKAQRRSNESYPHVFAETVTGLGEYVSIRKVKSAFGRMFWRHHYNQEKGLYYVSTK